MPNADLRVERLLGLVDAFCRGIGKECLELAKDEYYDHWHVNNPERMGPPERMRRELQEMRELVDELRRTPEESHV